MRQTRFARILLVIPLAGLALVLAGCNKAQSGLGLGAGIGAVTGAVVGHQSGHGGEGAAIGAAAGGALGYLIGNEQDKQDHYYRDHYYVDSPRVEKHYHYRTKPRKRIYYERREYYYDPYCPY